MNATQIVGHAEAAFELSISSQQQHLLEEYVRHLHTWSKRVSLISRNDRDLIWERHILDSLSVLPRLPAHGPLLDLGSGAGLPGIPVAILCPDIEVVLLEPSRMKALFLAEMVSVLELNNTRAIRSRAETLAADPLMRAKFQSATARAVATLPKLWDWVDPLLAPDGVFVAMKGLGALAEFSGEMPRAIQIEEEEITLPLIGRSRAFVSIRRCFT